MYIDQKVYKAQSINIKGKLFHFDTPKIMGIINLSHDSFYENDSETSVKDILVKIQFFIENGAEIIDIGGVSTKPGSRLPNIKEETNRVIPIIKKIRAKFPNIIISVDTVRSSVASEAILSGADIINDVSGGYGDKKMFETLKKYRCPYILTHNIKKSINNDKLKSESVIKEVIRFFSKKIKELKSYGVYDIIIDPGFGFSKSLEQNYELINYFEMLHVLHTPILVGISRKSMIYDTIKAKPNDSLIGTSIMHSFLISRNASVFRVHDVKEMKEVKMLWKASYY
jgi:dihydropteroate synthase